MSEAINHGLSVGEMKIIEDTLRDYRSDITRVGIFGSRANGTYKDYSDIDLVLYGDVTSEIVEHIYTLFDESNIGIHVDVLGYNTINYPPLKRQVDESAKTLFVND